MKKNIKLTERDLTRIVKRILNEEIKITPTSNVHSSTPQEFSKNFEGKTGTWSVSKGLLILKLDGQTTTGYNITCNPNQSSTSTQQPVR